MRCSRTPRGTPAPHGGCRHRQQPRLVGDTLSYSFTVLDGTVPASSGPVVLFIDPIGRPLSPMSVAAVEGASAAAVEPRIHRWGHAENPVRRRIGCPSCRPGRLGAWSDLTRRGAGPEGALRCTLSLGDHVRVSRAVGDALRSPSCSAATVVQVRSARRQTASRPLQSSDRSVDGHMVDGSPADLPAPQATAGVVVRPDGPDEPRNAGVERVAGAAIEPESPPKPRSPRKPPPKPRSPRKTSPPKPPPPLQQRRSRSRVGAALGPGHRGYRGRPPGPGSLLAARTGYQAARWNNVLAADYVGARACGSSRRKRARGRPGPPL